MSKWRNLPVQLLAGGARLPDRVYIGLSARTASGWGPFRWSRAVLGQDGRARLEGLRPGRYRVAVSVGRRGATGTAQTSREVTVLGGREVQLPPIRIPTDRGDAP